MAFDKYWDLILNGILFVYQGRLRGVDASQ